MSATATTLTVVAGGPTAPTSPFTITIDGEQMLVTAVSGNTWTVTRGYNGTKAALHLAAANVTNNTLWTVAESTWTLNGALTASQTMLTVSGGGPTPPNGPFYIVVGSEEMEVTNVNAATNQWTVVRGVGGTTAATHASGASVINRAQDGTKSVVHASGVSFTNNGDNAVQQGGLFPDMQVTSLQLMTGAMQSNGLLNESAGYNMLVASTYGEGAFAIRLDNSAVQAFPAPGYTTATAGPVVVSVAPVANPATTLTGITITFNEAIDPQTLLAANIVVFDPHGLRKLVVQSITEIGPSVYQATFVSSDTAVGLYSVSISGATDNAGNLMTPFSGVFSFPAGTATTPPAVFDFPGNAAVNSPAPGDGVYVFRSNSGFQEINGANATVLAIYPTGVTTYVVAGSFPGHGVFVYNSTTAAWTQLNTSTAAALAVDANGDVFASYSSFNQVIEYQAGSYNNPILIRTAAATSLAVDNNDDLFAAFSNGVMEYPAGSTGTTGWRLLNQNGIGAGVVAVNGSGATLAATFPGYGTFVTTVNTSAPYFSTFTQINPVGASVSAATASELAVDSNGDVIASFPNISNQGLQEIMPSSPGTYSPSSWTVVNVTAATGLALDTVGDLYAEFPGFGVFDYLPQTTGQQPYNGGNVGVTFKQLTLANVSMAQEDNAGALVAATPSQGLWEFTFATGWVRIKNAATTIMAGRPGGRRGRGVQRDRPPGVHHRRQSDPQQQFHLDDAQRLRPRRPGDLRQPHGCGQGGRVRVVRRRRPL